MAAFEALVEGGPDVQLAHGLVAFTWDRGYVTVMRPDYGEIVRAWGKDHAARQVAEWIANRPAAEEVLAAA